MLKSSFRRMLDMSCVRVMELPADQKELWCKYQKRRYELWEHLAGRKFCVRFEAFMRGKDISSVAEKFHKLHSYESAQHNAAMVITVMMSVDRIPDIH